MQGALRCYLVNHEALVCHNCGRPVRNIKPIKINRIAGVFAGLGGGVIGTVLTVLWIWQSESYFFSAAVGFLLGVLFFAPMWLSQKHLDRISVLTAAAILLLLGLLGNFFGWGAAIWGPGTEANLGFLPAAFTMLYACLVGAIDPTSFVFSTLEVYAGAMLGVLGVWLLYKMLSRRAAARGMI